MAWNLHAIEQARLRQHRVDGVGRLKSDFHTGLRLCLWCLCSLGSSSVAMVARWAALDGLPPPLTWELRPPRSDRWTACEAPGCRRASDRCLMAALLFCKD